MKCRIDGCDNKVGTRSETRLCHACYAALHYWNGRSIKDRVKRLDDLHKFQSRMETMVGNVKTIRSAKRKRRRA